MNIQDKMTIVGLGKGKGYAVMTDRRYEAPHVFIAASRADLLEYLAIHLDPGEKGCNNVMLVDAIKTAHGLASGVPMRDKPIYRQGRGPTGSPQGELEPPLPEGELHA